MSLVENGQTEKDPASTPLCVICSAENTNNLCEVENHIVWHCPECSSDFVWPMPEQSYLKELYDRKEWFEDGERGGYENYDDQTESLPQFLEEAFDLEKQDGSPKTVLDVGCGYGTHLAKAAEKGWQCLGVEVSDHARKIANERHGDCLYLVARAEDLPPRQVDLVLLLDVLEHLADPYPLFYTLYNLGMIGPQTQILITTPNAGSRDATTDPEKWAYRHPPSHLVYYSAQSLTQLLTQLRWNSVQVQGLHPFIIDPVNTAKPSLPLKEDLRDYAGLLCSATGSDFTEFMHERYVPGTWNEIAEYEHIPRYLLAQNLAVGLNVLDFGCGTGYGSSMLAQKANSVVGIDISEEALQWARKHHRNSNLCFERREDLGAELPADSFDMISCFEMIEHVDQQTQAAAIESFRRLLGPQGKLIISTPNPEVTGGYGENPYHIHEMDEEEFVSLLGRHFKYVKILRQWIRPSVLIAKQPLFSKDVEIQACSGSSGDSSLEMPSVAYIAVCSDTPFPDIEGICHFDSSCDYIAKLVSDLNLLQQERMKNISIFQKACLLERAVKEKDATIKKVVSEKNSAVQAIEGMVREKDATIKRVVLEKDSAVQAIEGMVREKDATIKRVVSEKDSAVQAIEGMVREKDATISRVVSEKDDVVEAWQNLEQVLDTYKAAGLDNLLRALKSETPFLKKGFAVLKAMAKVMVVHLRARKPSACCEEDLRSAGAPLVAQKVQAFYPLKERRPVIVHALANFMTGGSSRLVADLFEHLGHCYEQEVVTSFNPDPPAYTGIPIHEFTNRASYDEILNYFKNVQPELVHVHYWGDCDKPWYEKVFKAAEKYGCKVIENINTPVEPFFADYIDRYAYVSDYVLHHFGKSDGKSLTIYPGSNFEVFNREDVADVPDDCIGMVYRLETDKLNEQSIDVFIEVAKRRPKTKVLIVGGGTFLAPYKEAVLSAGVADSFVFTGYVSYEDLPALYNQMSLFVAPVWKESFGQVSPFAMSTGIPVVGYDIGALSEITADKNLLAPPGDSSRLAEIIINLLDDRERRLEIGVKNRERAHEKFSVEAMIDGYKSLYAELVGEEK